MLPILQIGPLAIQMPGLILLASLWLGLLLVEKNSHLFGIESNDLYNLSLLTLIAGIIGARVTYVLRYPSAFMASPLSIVSLNPGLLDPLGGFAVGLIAALVYGQRKKLPLFPTLDALVPAFAVLNIGISLSNLSSGNAFGAPTEWPWGISLWGELRHPTQIYNAIFAIIILIIFWPSQNYLRKFLPGITFFAFTASVAGTRLFVDAFRGDSAIDFGGLRISQLTAWLVLAISLFVIGWLRAKSHEEYTSSNRV